MAFPFLAAKGFKVGTSLLEPGQVDIAVGYLEQARQAGTEIVLPPDVIAAVEPAPDIPYAVVSADTIPADQAGLDIGPESAALFAVTIRQAGTVFWNGPMGVFELPAFAGGTKAVAQALTGGDAFTVVGGGDSGAAIRALGFPDARFGYVSTGGGASLEFIQGEPMPGLDALEEP